MTPRSLTRRAGILRSCFAVLFSGLLLAVVLAAALTPGEDVPAFGGVVAVDEVWVLACAALVFLMQAGFLAYEVGLSRPAHATVVAVKNVVDWAIGSLGFFVIGFSLMFGPSDGWTGGADLALLDGLAALPTSVSGLTFFCFQLAFAGTAITLVSGSLAERTTVLAYSVVAVVIAVVIYPVYGHWVWGDLLVAGNEPWLAARGFHDFAGGSVVHLLGATVAFVGIVAVGPRIGRFGPDGSVRSLPAGSPGLTMLGVLVLWFGWWGFNGGSHLRLDGSVAETIVATNLAGAGGLVSAGLTAYFFQGRYATTGKLIAGAIGGLVAVTPGADVASPLAGLATGLVAGWLCAVGHDLLLRLGVDDALGVVPAHGFCAVWGLCAVALFSTPPGSDGGLLGFLAVQLTGVAVCIAWAGTVSLLVFGVLRRFVGLRVAPELELAGQDLDAGTGPVVRVARHSSAAGRGR